MEKRLFTLLLLLFSTFALHAQRQETLQSNVRNRGGFGGLYFVASQADGESGSGAGIDGAFIVNDWFFGGYLQGDNFGRRRINNRNYEAGLFTTGAWAGYAFPSHKLVHFYTSLRLGFGGALLSRQDNDPFNNDDDYSDAVMVMAPEFGAEINAFKWFRIAGTVGYRMVGNIALPGYSARDFNSPTLALSLRFGWFGYK